MSDRIEALLSDGLGHFVKGDNAAAVACWEAVLAAEPANARAREFMAYVRSTSPPGAAGPATTTPPSHHAVAAPPPSPPPSVTPVVRPAVTPRVEEPAVALPAAPPPAAAVVDPMTAELEHIRQEEQSVKATAGRLPAVTASKTGEWFSDAVHTQSGTSLIDTSKMPTHAAAPPGAGFTPPPMTPGVAALGGLASPPFTPVPDPLLAQVLQEMRAAPPSPPPPSAPPPPSFTPPAPVHTPPPEMGSAALARGKSLFGAPAEDPPAPPPAVQVDTTPPAGPWEAVMSPAPAGVEGTTDSEEIEVSLEEDANADGLGHMWSPPAAPGVSQVAPTPAPVTPVPQPPVTSPWDEGALPTSGVVDLDRAEKSGSRAHAKVNATPRANVPGQQGGNQDVKSRCATMMARVKELHDLGDFSGSLEIVEKVLELDPKNAEARDYMERNEETLLKMYESKLGSLEKTPRMQMSPDQVIWLNLHHKAGFVLSRVDGMATFEDVLSLSAMPRLDTVRILAQLLQAGVITT